MGKILHKEWRFPEGSTIFFRYAIALPASILIFMVIMWFIIGFSLACIPFIVIYSIPVVTYILIMLYQSGYRLVVSEDFVVVRSPIISYRLFFPILIDRTIKIPMDEVESAYRNIFRSDVGVFLGKKWIRGSRLLQNEEMIANFKGKYFHIDRPKSKDKISKDQLMFMIFEYKPMFDIISQDIDKLSEVTRRNPKASGTISVAIRQFQMYIKSDMFIVMKRSFVKKNLLNNKPLYFVRHNVMPVYTNKPRKVVDLIQKRIKS